MALTIVNQSMIEAGSGSLSGHTVTPHQFGGVEGVDGPPQDVAMQAAIEYLRSIGGGVLDLTGNWAIKDGFVIYDTSGITVKSDAGRIHYQKPTADFYHMIRVSGSSKIRITGLDIYCDPDLVRNDTGFAVQVTTSFSVWIESNLFTDIALACIWIDNSQDLHVNNNTINSAKADGIHFSDGCLDFVCSGNTINLVEDDAIAVVRDVGGTIPNSGVIDGNVVREIIYGHGVVLISCNNIVVSNNQLSGFSGAAIGSYIWSGTAALSQGLLITGNKISDTARSPNNAASASSILFLGTANSAVVGNDIQGPGTVNPSYPYTAVIFVDNYSDLVIKGNIIRDSAAFGIMYNPNAGIVSHDLVIENNHFTNIVQSPIKLTPTPGTLGRTYIHGNVFRTAAYLGSGNVIEVARAGTNRIYIGGSRQVNQARPYYVQASTSTNVVHEFNSPNVSVS